MSFIALLPPYIALINLLPIYKHFHADEGVRKWVILRGGEVSYTRCTALQSLILRLNFGE